LDAEVARVAFGRTDLEQRQWHDEWQAVLGPYPFNEQCVRCGAYQGRTYGVAGRSGPCCPRFPRYSTDIAAAMTVFERLVEIGLEVMLSRDPGDPYEVEVSVTKALYVQGCRGCVIQDDSAPRAICRAALLALAALPAPAEDRR
jgi:hypothetical protein